MEHFPNLPSKQFAGKSRIGQYGDKLMEGDYHVGQILDALKELGVDGNTLLDLASVNGPQGKTAREIGNQGSPDMGNSGPFRGNMPWIGTTGGRDFAASSMASPSKLSAIDDLAVRPWSICRGVRLWQVRLWRPRGFTPHGPDACATRFGTNPA